MYYLIKTDDRYAFELDTFETEEKAMKALEEPFNFYDYKVIIKGNIVAEIKE